MRTIILSLVALASMSAQQSPSALQLTLQIKYTTLSVAMNTTDTTFTVADASQFTAYNISSGSPQLVYVENEIIRVCGLSGAVFTVCGTGQGRGAQGTKSPAHSVGVDSGIVQNKNFNAGLVASYAWFMQNQKAANGTSPKYADAWDLLWTNLKQAMHHDLVVAAAAAGVSGVSSVSTAQATAASGSAGVDSAVTAITQ